MAFLFPTRSPVIEAGIDSTNPAHIGIHLYTFIHKITLGDNIEINQKAYCKGKAL